MGIHIETAYIMEISKGCICLKLGSFLKTDLFRNVMSLNKTVKIIPNLEIATK